MTAPEAIDAAGAGQDEPRPEAPVNRGPTFDVVIHGTGKAQVAAYGVADAEATVEKEIRNLLPGAAIRISEVRRGDPHPRIVEAFEVSYAVSLRMEIAGERDEDAARRQAFRTGRTALEGSRFGRTIWERAEVERR